MSEANPLWYDLSEALAGDEPADLKTVRTWSLVLSSRGINHRIRGATLLVLAEEAEQARTEILRYEDENEDWTPDLFSTPDIPLKTDVLTPIVCLVLAGFHLAVQAGWILPTRVWIDMGAVAAGRMLDGELWRMVTALTLHSDGQHIISNVVLGGLFVSWLSREVGAGYAWALTVGSGALGNLVNAFFQAPWHRAIGASTAVFAAIGVLTALQVAPRQGESLMRRLVPIGAGLVLLGFFGAGDENTDVGAHIFGFFVGFAVGVWAGRYRKEHGLPGPERQRQLGGLAIGLVAIAWLMASAGRWMG
ncbi:MAG: rhomboid family intramembrane serine protease [Bacteroidota bacterium]